MLAILDPHLFHPEHPVDSDALERIVHLLRRAGCGIPSVDWYWHELNEQFISPLHRRKMADRPYRDHLFTLRRWTREVQLPEPPRCVSVWHFRAFFQDLGPEWLSIMLRLVTGCVLSGEPTVLVTCLRDGRNAVHHQHGHVLCVEKTCWNLRLRPEGHGLSRVPAVASLRNVAVPWTCRYDDHLPAAEDGAAFPFCPDPAWQKTSTEVFGTHEARPAWFDARGNAWAKPSTGGGYHWDVFLTSKLHAEYGLGQLNIVAWGGPPSEGLPGSRHHVPGRKQGRLKKKTGWTC